MIRCSKLVMILLKVTENSIIIPFWSEKCSFLFQKKVGYHLTLMLHIKL